MDDSLRSDPCALAVRAAALAPGMGIPCDTIGRAVAGSLDAGDFTASSCTTYARVLEGMARALGPGRAVVELDAGELTGWFQHTRAHPRRPRPGDVEPRPGHRLRLRPPPPITR
jgi:hypothetical protein